MAATTVSNVPSIEGTNVNVRFSAANGSRYTSADANRIGPELIKLKNSHNGSLTKELLVTSARDEESPLHQYFEWNDVKAAQAHRLEQARYMMRSVLIVWDESKDDGSTQSVQARLFHNVKKPVTTTDHETGELHEHGKQSVFVTFTDVVENPDYARQVIDSTEKALRRIDSRFRFYLEQIPAFRERFQALFDEISDLLDE